MALSPMMKQYLRVKEENPDCIVMFRLGDFYEMFFEDAVTASGVLDIVLTGRDCGEEERAPMCGVPYHAADSYIYRLIKAGYRVAVCEQMEDPKSVKGIVRREVVRVITPGTVTDGEYLPREKNNYIMSVWKEPDRCGAAFADVSTGEIRACGFEGSDCAEQLVSETAAYRPAEALLPDDCPVIRTALSERYGTMLTDCDPALFDEERSFSEASAAAECDPSLKGTPAMRAAGALIGHLRTAQKLNMSFVRKIDFYSPSLYLRLDSFSRRNLELTESANTREKRGSLLWVIDRTCTSMGARELRRRIETPLLDCERINRRLDSVGELKNDRAGRDALRRELSALVDMGRLASRIAYGTANPRDLKALEGSMSRLPAIKELLSHCSSAPLADIFGRLDTLDDLCASINKYIVDDPPVSIREGGIIKPGANRDADELRDTVQGGREWIARIEKTERELTGIKTLRVGYNRVFGYYIEVSKSFSDSVPDRYIRRQTLADRERFVTPELKDMETRVINARGRLYDLEAELFLGLSDHLKLNLFRIRRTADAVAEADVFQSLAAIADESGYCRPDVDDGDVIDISAGRHPVVEKLCGDGYFVPNDCLLDCGENRLHIITGPNMAGKSTFMRQVADIVLLAQCGSFVPADRAHIGVVDRIFTRVGASDDLSGGTSTFMLEMKEVAAILSSATEKSLIIYDEIGRGTSTYDGMAIARAVLEHTAVKIRAKTLFATHYHELTELEGQIEGVLNYNVAAKKRGEEVIFLRRIVRGHADDSYGIEVASLAGVPKEVVRRAGEILRSLTGQLPLPRAASVPEGAADAEKTARLKKLLECTDINTVTPIEAMSILNELLNLVK